MKRKFLLLFLLILPLLCGAGEAEDPRALWREADAALAGYNSVDIDTETEIRMTVDGKETISVVSTRIRGTDLLGKSPAIQIVNTGDQMSRMYYANGVLYADMPYGEWQSPMTLDEARSFLLSDELSAGEETFKEVELVSTEDGYEIKFAKPSEEFVARFIKEAGVDFADVKAENTELHGIMLLHPNGDLRELTFEVELTMGLYGGRELIFSIRSSDRLLSHDEDITVLLPDKLRQYQKCENVRAYAMLYDALTEYELAGSLEFKTEFSYDGMLFADTTKPRYVRHTWLERDPLGGDFRYYQDYCDLNSAGNPAKAYGLDLTPEESKYMAANNHPSLELTAEESLGIMLADIKDFSNTEQLNFFEDVRLEEVGDHTEIHFRPSKEYMSLLTVYVVNDQLTKNRLSWLLSIYDQWKYENASGIVILDEEGRLESLLFMFYFDAPGAFMKTSGTVSYSKTVIKMNEAVEFPEEYVEIYRRWSDELGRFVV